MKRAATYMRWTAVIVLGVEAVQSMAAEQRSSTPLGLITGDAMCEVRQTHEDQWQFDLMCVTDAGSSGNVKKKVEAGVMWLLLADGRAAAPVSRSRDDYGFGSMGLISMHHTLHIAFENVRDPIALVLRFDEKLQTFSIPQESPGPPGVVAAAAVAGISNGGNAATLAQQGYTNLGGLALTEWCQATYGADFRAWARGSGAGDWSCQRNANDRREISMDDACKWQYGKPDAKAEALGDVVSWQCWVPGPVK